MIWGFLICVMLSPIATFASDESSCPRGGHIHLSNLNCYWLNPVHESWQNARRICRQTSGADLARVKNQDVQNFIYGVFSMSEPVWIGLSDIDSPGRFHWVDGSPVQNLQDQKAWEKPEHNCVYMDSSRERRGTACSKKTAFICEKPTEANLPNVDVYVAGLPIFTGVYNVKNVSIFGNIQTPVLGANTELILFPGLWFSHSGFVLSAEFVMQETQKSVWTQILILRPYCNPNFHLIPPGCETLHTPFAVCHSQPLCNMTGGCPAGQQWCHLKESCLPVISPCSAYAFENETSNITMPPRYKEMPPFYSQVAAIPLVLEPATEKTHVHVLLSGMDISVYPDDIIAVQHDGRPGSLIHCQQSTSSPWRQSFASLFGVSWWAAGISQPFQPTWVDNVICNLRFIYTDDMHNFAVTPLLSHKQNTAGEHTYTVTVKNPVSSTATSCIVVLQTQISELQIIYPQPENGKINLAANQASLIVIKIASGSNATSSWSSPISQTGVVFSSSCPLDMPQSVPECNRNTEDTWFSFVHVMMVEPLSEVLTIQVSNEVSFEELSAHLQVYEVISGLHVVPAGPCRLIVDMSQTFTAEVIRGSDVTYTWTIDDKALFSHTGKTHTVSFKRTAKFQLKVVAENPVSSETVETELMVDTRKPLADPEFLAPLQTVPTNISQILAFRVKVDTALGITFRWNFGDGNLEVEHYFPAAYDPRQPYPNLLLKQMLLKDEITHTYTRPGDYTVHVAAFNTWDKMEVNITINVRSYLSALRFDLTPSLPLVNASADFIAHSQPSSKGITYTWYFGDGSPAEKITLPTIQHKFVARGSYNVTLLANNSISVLTFSQTVVIGEDVTGVEITSSGPNELGSETVVFGTVKTGSNIRWNFDMGDGITYTDLRNGSVTHKYEHKGNYTVVVTAKSSIKCIQQSISIEVFQLKILRVIPTNCCIRGMLTQFMVETNRHVEDVKFMWNFGDDSKPVLEKGKSTSTKTYSSPGNYPLSVTLYSQFTRDSFEANICVEEKILSVMLIPSKTAFETGEKARFLAIVEPRPDILHHYTYHWDFGIREPPLISTQEITFTYVQKGVYLVSVSVQNRVSEENSSSLITIERPIKTLSLFHDGNNTEFLVVNRTYGFRAEVNSATNVIFKWDFGDGSSPKDGESPVHRFNSSGGFTIRVLGENLVSSKENDMHVVVLFPITGLNLSSDCTVCQVMEEVTFRATVATGSDVHYLWSASELQNFHEEKSAFGYVFNTPGVFIVSVIARNPVSQEKLDRSVIILEKIDALKIVSADLIKKKYTAIKQAFTLNAFIAQGSNVSFQWTILQGSSVVFTEEGHSVTFLPESAGELVITVTAKNALGKISDSITIVVVEPVNGVKIYASANCVAVGIPINFTIAVSSGSHLRYIWYLGAGQVPLETNSSTLSYVFYAAGFKVISVTVTNALGSFNGSTEMKIQELISEVSFYVFNTTQPLSIPSNTSVQFHGQVEKGTDILWKWTLLSKFTDYFCNQVMSYSFKDPGLYELSLNASNDVSWKSVTKVITVQNRIEGFTVTLNKNATCLGDPVTFHFDVRQGTDPAFFLNFTSLHVAHKLLNDTYCAFIPTVGLHHVLVTAANNVSSQLFTTNVLVTEKVEGLHLSNCCPSAMEVKKELLLLAEIKAGLNVTYSWLFHLSGYPDVKAKGKTTSYTPFGSGHLLIRIEASNGLCSSWLQEAILVQEIVTAAKLTTNDTRVFTNQVVVFQVTVKTGSNIYYVWKFGDSDDAYDNHNSTVIHQYRNPGDYQIEVKAYNNISFAVAKLTISVASLKCTLPHVSLSAPTGTILRSQVNYFEAIVDLKRCTAYRAVYLWEVFQSDCMNMLHVNQIHLGNVDTAGPLLILPRLTLGVGSHCLRFTIRLQDTPLSQTAVVGITVHQSKLVAVITGGFNRICSIFEDLVLDGTKSYDPDVGKEEDSSLEYYWQMEKQNQSSVPYLPLANQHQGRLTVSRDLLRMGKVYIFALTVRKPGKEAVSTVQKVTVTSAKTIPVTLECQSCAALSSYEISRSVHVTLSGRCETCDGNAQYKWAAQSSDGAVLKLDNVTTSTGDSSTNLVIRQGALQDGVNYTFTLTAFYLGLQGSSSITLSPNEPPRGGVCIIHPNTNIYVLETPVTYECKGWSDDSSNTSQLIYSFIVMTCTHDLEGCQKYYLYRGTKSSFSAFVPLGDEGSRTTICVLIELEDLLGAKTLALNRTLTVSVPDVPLGFHGVTEWIKKKSESDLWGVVQRGNPQEVIPYSIALISTLNQGQETSQEDQAERIAIRRNVTRALTSLNIISIEDVTQISSALAQCAALPQEFASADLQETVLEATRKMISVISKDTGQGTATPISAGKSILQLLAGSVAALGFNEREGRPPDDIANTAVTAFNLTSLLMKSLMQSRVQNEETLTILASGISIQGKRTSPTDLLCGYKSEECHFHIPDTFSSQLLGNPEVVQVLIHFTVNPFCFSFADSHTVSTALASLEFTTPSGQQIPVSNLSVESAITVKLKSRKTARNFQAPHMTSIPVPPRDSVNFTVKPDSTAAAVYVSITLNTEQVSMYVQEEEPFVHIFVHYNPFPNEFQHMWKKEVVIFGEKSEKKRERVVFLSPQHNDTRRDYYVNITNYLFSVQINASVMVYSALCQYFDFQKMHWSTEGVIPVAVVNQEEILCRTEHLTVFGASLFVAPDAVVFLHPDGRITKNYIVAITCVVLLAIYIIIALIGHKLDYIDINRVGVIPLCGPSGRYKYRVLVKTGWSRGSGTTAHIGISLYGLNKSGSRHLDKDGAFQRNNLDVFQIETDANLGEIWKIRIWHDNTGLDPSWFLEYVIVWDKQTDHMYVFIVKDWLSVENEKNEGMVEKEVLAACPEELKQFSQIFPAQLRHGISNGHIWLSVWDRPPHSRFTRVQRVTCCAVLLFLFISTTTVWYGAIGVKSEGVPVASRTLVSGESLAVGVVVALVSFPVYLLFDFLFRRTHSKVLVEDPEPSTMESQTIEMDVCLDHSDLGTSSFLSIPGGLDSVMDVRSDSSMSLRSKKLDSVLAILTKQNHKAFLQNWPSCDSMFEIPDLLSSDLLSTRCHILKRKKALLKLGIESPLASDEDPIGFSTPASDDSRKSTGDHLTLSEEELLKSIIADSKRWDMSDQITADSGRFSSRGETDLISDIFESSCGTWSNLSEDSWGSSLHKSFSYMSASTMSTSYLPSPEPPFTPVSSFNTRIGVSRNADKWLFPNWLLSLTFFLCFLLLVSCITVTVLYGGSFSNSVLLMWLVSILFSFLTSFFLLEPLKVLLEAIFAALVTKPVSPEEDDGLIEEPLVKKTVERIRKVRAPYGYGLLQAKEEARKVRTLRSLMKNCIIHMLFLLVVLVINYQSCFRDTNIRLLHVSVKQSLVTRVRNGLTFTAIKGYSDMWSWMDNVLLPHLYNNPSLTLVGSARLRQQCSLEGHDFSLAVKFGHQNYSMGFHTCTHLVSEDQEVDLENNDFALDMDVSHSQNSSPDVFGRFWYWGELGIYDGGGYSQLLAANTNGTRSLLRKLEACKWINRRTKVVFVEFSQYSPHVDLYVAVTLTFEFSPTQLVFASFSIRPFPMLCFSDGPDLILVMMVLLVIFSISFLCSEIMALYHNGVVHLWQGQTCLCLLIVALGFAVAGTHFIRIWLSDIHLNHYKRNPGTFTSFHTVAFLADLDNALSAFLLTIIILKLVRQLRFVRRWSAFGKTFQHAIPELTAAAAMFLVLIVIFTLCGCLVFSSSVQDFSTIPLTFYWLISLLCGAANLQEVTQQNPVLGPVYFLTYIICLSWIGRSLIFAVVVQSYRDVQAEMYRPAIEPQDYEMIEFFVKRFKLWLGLSKAKEFRHKVKFEGMESLPSRSSAQTRISQSPSSVPEFQCSGSTISSGSMRSDDLILPESPSLETSEVDYYLERLLPTVNSLLQHFDRVNKASEDLLQIETNLQQTQKRINEKKKQKAVKGKTALECSRLPATRRQTELPRTYSTFSESAVARLRCQRNPASDCTFFQRVRPGVAADAMHQGYRRKAWAAGPPLSADVCQRHALTTTASNKWRPKSEEGAERLGYDHPRLPIKKRAWQLEEVK